MNRDLAKFFDELPTTERLPSAYPTPEKRRLVRDRLSEKDIAELIAAFTAGTPKHVLATQYDVSLKSVKRLLREHGIRGWQHGRQC